MINNDEHMNQDGLSNFAEGPVACLPSPFLYLLTRHEGSPSASRFPSRPVDDAVKPVNECFSKKMAHGGSNMLEHSQATDPAQFLGQHSSKTICLLQTFRHSKDRLVCICRSCLPLYFL